MDNNNYYSQSRSEMMKFLPPNFTNVLEIGCGQGEFGKLVKQTYKTNYTGIDANPVAAVVAKENLDFVLIGDAFEQIEALPNHSFDLLICNDILEHLATPEILLQKVRIKMKPDASLVCSIPNFRVLNNLIHILLKKDFKYTNDDILDKTHLRFFTKKSIIRLLNDNGLNIIEIVGINPIRSFKTIIPLGILRILGHGDIRFHQFGITAKF